MNQYHMSSEELEISRIKNIQSISIYDLVVPNRKDTEPLVFGMMVSYDNKYLNYCELDGLFNKFKKKVLEQYRVEASEKNIYVDNITKKFLELDTPMELPENIKFYIEGKSYLESIFCGSTKKIKKFESILKYHLSIILKYLEKEFVFGEFSGYRDNLFLPTDLEKKSGININILKIRDDYVELRIGGLLEKISFLKCTISIDSENVKVLIVSDDENLSMEFNYKLKDNGIQEEAIITSNGICNYYNNSVEEKEVTEEELKKINLLFSMDNSDERFDKAYALPWRGYFMMSEAITDLIDSYSSSNKNTAYIEFNPTYINLLSFNEVILISKTGHRLKINGSEKKTDIFKVKNYDIAIAETHFGNLYYSNGLYKENLSDKYFCGIVEMDSFENPSRILLENLEKESEVELEPELFDETIIKKNRK